MKDGILVRRIPIQLVVPAISWGFMHLPASCKHASYFLSTMSGQQSGDQVVSNHLYTLSALNMGTTLFPTASTTLASAEWIASGIQGHGVSRPGSSIDAARLPGV